MDTPKKRIVSMDISVNRYLVFLIIVNGKFEGNIHLRNGREGPERE
jgi:hypothetical protein